MWAIEDKDCVGVYVYRLDAILNKPQGFRLIPVIVTEIPVTKIQKRKKQKKERR